MAGSKTKYCVHGLFFGENRSCPGFEFRNEAYGYADRKGWTDIVVLSYKTE